MVVQKKSSHVLLYSLLALLGVLLIFYVFREMSRCRRRQDDVPAHSTSPIDPRAGELAKLRQKILDDFKALRGRLPTLNEIKAELAKLRGQAQADLENLKRKVKADLAALRGRLPSPAEVHDEIAKLIAQFRSRHPSQPSQPSQPAQAPEVFWVRAQSVLPGDDSSAVCAAYGASVASVAQMQDAVDRGASWCAAATVADDDQLAYWPNQYTDGTCSAFGLNSQAIYQGGDPATSGVNCFGIKPSPDAGSDSIMPFSQITGQWNML